ncbi:hypothetical protein ACIGEP_13610 [Microbacterium sp. NPDC077663]|uniref:hypothetical protein n=1 Tax=Microbacterium sp. NPDC077663 TaxID=3364189 RepID=UPI0037CB2536
MRAAENPRRTIVLIVSLSLVAAAILAYGLRVAWLMVLADEGDVPPASALALPTTVTVSSETIGCGSGGCSRTLTLTPTDGTSAEELADDLGTTPQLLIAGNVFDPRTISAFATTSDGELVVTLDYSSTPYVP